MLMRRMGTEQEVSSIFSARSPAPNAVWPRLQALLSTLPRWWSS